MVTKDPLHFEIILYFVSLQLCQAFLNTSMKQQSFRFYCCPEGETDRLCKIDDVKGHRCKYCWFRRLELDGLVDRWIICDGNPVCS